MPPEVNDVESLFTTGIHQGINFDKYDNIEVEVTGNNRPKPVESFDDMGLLPTFLQNVRKAGYTKPTPIQKHAIPAVLSGRDLMGCAQTGSGKTVSTCNLTFPGEKRGVGMSFILLLYCMYTGTR